jgi:hypothetical protein
VHWTVFLRFFLAQGAEAKRSERFQTRFAE